MTRETVTLSIAEIGELPLEAYVGLIDESAIECLKVRIAAEGLHTPIWVRSNGNASKTGRYSVVAGRHRLRAAKALGWTDIRAEVRAGPDSKPDDLKRLQLAENLDRRILRPIELALNIMHRWRAAAEVVIVPPAANQQTAAIRRRWGVLADIANTQAGAKREIDEATARACAISVRKIQSCRAIFEKLVLPFPEYFAAINAHPLGEALSAMESLASKKFDPNFKAGPRLTAINKLLERNDWESIQAVFVAAGLDDGTGSRVDPNNHRAVIFNVWTKMPPEERRAFLMEDLPPSLSEQQAQDLVVKLMNSFDKLRGVKP